ncbi:carboxymuconolactone decarboxylase family protein [Paraburkholderia phenoliruptrix]|uniref:carboxymuconolactone decarboxylase family protein n=1 Tax=Paraburkholderia phenoliruptrix TaxID=252970 RepID=UPI0009E3747C
MGIQNVSAGSPALLRYKQEALFQGAWQRPALHQRDRSTVTVAALVTSGQFAQISYHLGRAINNGLTRTEASEMVSHLAYYAGWPNTFSAVPVVKSVFESRAQ